MSESTGSVSGFEPSDAHKPSPLPSVERQTEREKGERTLGDIYAELYFTPFAEAASDLPTEIPPHIKEQLLTDIRQSRVSLGRYSDEVFVSMLWRHGALGVWDYSSAAGKADSTGQTAQESIAERGAEALMSSSLREWVASGTPGGHSVMHYWRNFLSKLEMMRPSPELPVGFFKEDIDQTLFERANTVEEVTAALSRDFRERLSLGARLAELKAKFGKYRRDKELWERESDNIYNDRDLLGGTLAQAQLTQDELVVLRERAQQMMKRHEQIFNEPGFVALLELCQGAEDEQRELFASLMSEDDAGLLKRFAKEPFSDFGGNFDRLSKTIEQSLAVSAPVLARVKAETEKNEG